MPPRPPRTAIPVHYEGWSHFRQGREEIERELETHRMTSAGFRLSPIGAEVDIAA